MPNARPARRTVTLCPPMSNPTFSDAEGGDAPRPSLSRLLDALALGAVLALAWRACRGHHHQRRRARSARAPAAVHTWEGEGGRPLPEEHPRSGVAR
jgi:hypothetical protein